MNSATEFVLGGMLAVLTAFPAPQTATPDALHQVGLTQLPAGFHAITSATVAVPRASFNLRLEANNPKTLDRIAIRRETIDIRNISSIRSSLTQGEQNQISARGCSAPFQSAAVIAGGQRIALLTQHCGQRGHAIVHVSAAFTAASSEYHIIETAKEAVYSLKQPAFIIRDLVAHAGDPTLPVSAPPPPPYRWESISSVSGLRLHSLDMVPLPCTAPGSHSELGKLPTQLQITNSSTMPIDVDWLDSRGKSVRYATIAASQNWYANTFAMHAWQLSSNGKCLTVLTATIRPGSITIHDLQPPQ